MSFDIAEDENGSENDFDLSIKLIVLGESGVGKTNIINRYCGLTFQEDSKTTSASSYMEKKLRVEDKVVNLNLWDTAGQEKFHSVTKIFMKNSHICVLVYAINNKNSFSKLPFWLQTAKEQCGENVLFALAANKSDLYYKEEIPEEEGREFARKNQMKFGLMSAKEFDSSEIENFINGLVKEYVKKSGYVDNENVNKTLRVRESKNKKKKRCC